MRTRYSSAQWRIFATRPIVKVKYYDGSVSNVRVSEVIPVIEEIEWISLPRPSSDPMTTYDRRAAELGNNILDGASALNIRTDVEDW